MSHEPLTEIERLLTDDERRDRFPEARRDFIKPIHREVDDIDLAVEADPLIDHAPELRGHGKIRRVLEILDSLGNEGGAG